MKAVIFDLDDTLVASGPIRALRDAGNWDAVRQHINSILVYPGVPEMLQHIKSAGCKIGVVTSSPRWYAEQLIANHKMPVDAVVAGGECNYGKPNPAPFRVAMRALGVAPASEVIAVGDRCIDTLAAFDAGTRTIGAFWGAPNHRDLRISWPQHIASTPAELVQIFDALCASPEATDGLAKKHGWVTQNTIDDLWRRNPPGDYRMHLSGAYAYTHARYKYAAGWSASRTNSLVTSFKSTKSSQRQHKEYAVKQFGFELGFLIPKGAYVTYVLTSTKKGEVGHDDRCDLLATDLLARGINSIWPISLKASTEPAHEAPPDSELRDPAFIKANLEWNGNFPADCTEIYLVDDVLTKGGHFRAYADLISESQPGVTVHCVAWSLHTSAHWHESQA